MNALGDLTVSTIHTRDQRTAFVQRAASFRTPTEEEIPEVQPEAIGADPADLPAEEPDGPPASKNDEDLPLPVDPSAMTDSHEPHDASDNPAPNEAGQGEQPAPVGIKPSTQPKPKFILFPGLTLYNVSDRVQTLLWEAQKLDLGKTLNTGAILIRVIVELATDDALTAGVVKDVSIDKPLSLKLTKALAALGAAGAHKTITGPVNRFVSSRDFRSLHDYVHSASGYPKSPEEISRTSGIFVPFLRELDGLIRTAGHNGNA